MDLYCRICAEPIDNDELHDVAEAIGSTYEAVAADFRTRGCKALEEAHGPQTHCTPGDPGTSESIATVYDLLGDDMDGAASMFDDLGL